MIYAQLPECAGGKPRKLPFYLAMEEYLARNFEGEYFFMWQVDPTVIFGRNQQMEAEVNTAYCRANGVAAYRRKSGGGCVYADRNNIMFSHITTCSSVTVTFSAFTERVARMLRDMGIADAHTTGRNDIMIGDRKVSGYAFYHINLTDRFTHAPESRAIVHGTMLYDVDLQAMNAALTPSEVKLQAKGVESVRSRVTTIKEHSKVSLGEFKDFARRSLCDSVLELNAADVEAIEALAAPYCRDSWIAGGRRCDLRSPRRRVEGVGEFVVDLVATSDATPCIDTIDLAGDFFLLGDIDRHLLAPLSGCELTRDALMSRLGNIRIDKLIPNLRAEQLTDIILESISN